MKKNGFTLVELLAIIVILGLIMVLAAPNLGKQMQKNEENTKSILNTKIENASKLYIAKYYASKVAEVSESSEIKFTLDDLQRDGLLSLKGNDGCSRVRGKFIVVTINADSIKYNYEGIKNEGCYNDN